MGLQLRIVSDPCPHIAKSQVRAFGEEGGDIGRAPSSYWTLPDPKVYMSAHHCRIEFDDGAYWLHDVSRNGVFLNESGKSIGQGRRVRLRSGDRLRIAEYEMVASVDEEIASAAVDTAVPVVDQRTHRSPGHTGQYGVLACIPEFKLSPGRSRAIEQGIRQLLRRLSGHRPIVNTERALKSAMNGIAASRKFQASELNPVAMARFGVLLGTPDPAALNAYKLLRTRLRRRFVTNHWRSVTITSEGQGVGKTVTATNLAITFAQDPRTPVFLVDLDLHRPQVAHYLGMHIRKGLSDYLLGDAEIEEIIYSVGIGGLAVVPNVQPLENASELLTSPRMLQLVRFLQAEKPDHVILYDMPPLMLSDDVLAFAPHTDCVLDVVAVGITRRASLEAAKDILAELNLVGIVLNRSKEQNHQLGYTYY
jgi:protein-tyrosine kinase